MPTLYHSPFSRSSTLAAVVDELGADIEIRTVSIPRQDGSGGRDPANPHFEGKVPYFIDGDEHLHERGAIILWLTDAYPEAGLGPIKGQPGRGAYLSWLFYFHGVMEPVLLLDYIKVDHPVMQASLRDTAAMAARLESALSKGPWLLGERFSAADLLCASPFLWMPDFTPDVPVIRDWVKRVSERPSVQRVQAQDAAAMQAL